VELAGKASELAASGCLVAAISVDDVGKNAAMTEKLALPFPLLADPGGEGAIKPLGVWSDKEGGLARAAIVLLAPDGSEAFRYEGRDYADRPNAELLLAAARALALPPRPEPESVYPHAEPAPSERAFTRERLVPYLRGVRSASLALRGRGGGEEAERMVSMAERYLAVLSQ